MLYNSIQKTFKKHSIFILMNKYRKNEVVLHLIRIEFFRTKSLKYFYCMQFEFSNVSFWEQKWLTSDLDFIVVGAGIVGLSTAFHLKKTHPKAKILVLDKGVLPFTASSKNAGFACFGSPSEIMDDLSNTPEMEVWKTVEMRWKGLQALKNWLGEKEIDLQTLGSWDLMENKTDTEEIRSKLKELNLALKSITGEANVYAEDKEASKRFGFENLDSAFKNKLEGQLDTSLLIQTAIKRAQDSGITILRGVEMKSYSSNTNHVILETNYGELKSSNLVICTNGFTPEIDEKTVIRPARAQVLITKEMPDLKTLGTFHIDSGYYYFRNVGYRLLIGGGRNLDFKKEETTELFITQEIQSAIEEKLKRIILPKTTFEIEHRWAGIMGIGNKKEPIIKRVDSRVCIGVRMGGMGVAIGTLVGQRLAEMCE